MSNCIVMVFCGVLEGNECGVLSERVCVVGEREENWSWRVYKDRKAFGCPDCGVGPLAGANSKRARSIPGESSDC